MATILKARGRMTKDLVTPHEAGQEVVLIDLNQIEDPDALRRLRLGERGIIRKVIISDAKDGDATFPMFYVRFGTFTTLLHSSEFAPAAKAEAYLWACRQIDGLARAR